MFDLGAVGDALHRGELRVVRVDAVLPPMRFPVSWRKAEVALRPRCHGWCGTCAERRRGMRVSRYPTLVIAHSAFCTSGAAVRTTCWVDRCSGPPR